MFHAMRAVAGWVAVAGITLGGFFGAVAEATEVRVTHINGPAVRGKVQSATDEALRLRELQDENAPESLNLREVEEIEYVMQADPETPDERFTLVLRLITGDLFVGRVVGDAPDGFIFESAAFGRFPVDLDWIQRIDIRKNQEQFQFQESPTPRQLRTDALYYKPPPGTNQADVLTGDLERITIRGVDFFDADDTVQDIVEWNALVAVTRYVDAPRDQPAQFQVIVAARNGERFTGKLLGMENRTYRIRSYVLRPSTRDPQAQGPDAQRHGDGLTLGVYDERLNKLTFRHGKFAYLSDMPVEAAVQYPYFGGPSAMPRNLNDYWWNFQRDRAVTGGPLTLRAADMRRVIYTKGLGVHSYCKLTFRLDGQYARFMADIGLDDSAGQQGSVIFEVYCDDEPQPRYRSPSVLRRSAALVSIDVDVRGARRIHLVVDFGDNGDIQDRANWAKARVIKER